MLRPVTILVAALFLFVGAPAKAQAFVTGSSEDSSDFLPYASAYGDTVERPAWFKVRVYGSPYQLLSGREYVSCHKGNKHRTYSYSWTDWPGTYWVRLPIKRDADYCWMGESVEFANDEASGTVGVILYAKQRKSKRRR